MSTPIKRSLLIGLLVTILASCGIAGSDPQATTIPDPTTSSADNPYAPQPGDEGLVRNDVEIVKADLATLESFPPQFVLNVSFFTPTPCHQYRLVVSPPGADNQIDVQVYSLRKPDQVCTLMRLNTPTEVSLNLGSFASGHYTLWVNGEKVVEFDA